MVHLWIYLILSSNRLIISATEINNADHFKLMDSTGGNYNLVYDNCKVYCIGYIQGSLSGRRIVNDIREFE
jgi:hypothetical protein